MGELFSFLGALSISFLLTGAMLRFSLKRSLLDIPNDRSSHSIPKPRLGGVAITISFCAVCIVLLFADRFALIPYASMAGVVAGGVIVAIFGLIDDLRTLDARVKILGQLAAAAAAVSSGIILREFRLPLVGDLELGPLAVPVTVLWIVAMINFYNFIDGIDGLAAGVGMIAAIFLAFIAATAGSNLKFLYAVLAGSCFGFLRFNFPPARIFMGDMGSTFIGYIFAVLAVAGERVGVPAFLTVLVLASAVGDAALTLLRRMLKREKILSPHRTHYYQRLTSLGLSHKQVTLLEYAVAVLLGASALIAFRHERIFVVFMSAIWMGFFIWALAKIRSMERGEGLFWKGRALGIAFGDIAFIALSYIMSYWLRLNFRFPQAETSSMLISLPMVLVIRTVVFYRYGLYRSIWRYTTFDDIVRIAKAVSIGSAIMLISFTLIFRFRAFPRSVFIIDWFVLTVFMAGSRIGARWFHELPAKEDIEGKRVIIAGTGPAVEALLARLKRIEGVIPIGCLDDRLEMTGKIAHGLSVLGTFAEARRAALSAKAEEILVFSSCYDRIPRDVLSALEEDGISVRLIFDPDAVLEEGVSSRSRVFENSRVLFAGNGALIERVGEIIEGACGISIVSNDPACLTSYSGKTVTAISRQSLFLGDLSDRSSLSKLLAELDPEVAVCELTTKAVSVANEDGAYFSIVLVPLERLASECSARNIRSIVILRETDHRVGADAAEAIVRDVYRTERSLLTVLRLAAEPTRSEWVAILNRIALEGGKTFRCIRKVAGEEATLEIVQRGSVSFAYSKYLEVLRSARGLDEEILKSAMEEMARSLGVYVSSS